MTTWTNDDNHNNETLAGEEGGAQAAAKARLQSQQT